MGSVEACLQEQSRDQHEKALSKRAHPYERHIFSDDILRRVKACYKTDNWHGPKELAEDWLVIGVSIWLSLLASEHLHIALAVAVYAIAVFFIGGRQRALADILHQAAHGTLARNRKLNWVLGTLPSGYLILQSFTGYRSSHLIYHHGKFADPELDPDYVQYKRSGLCGEGLNTKNVQHYLIRIFSPVTMLCYLRYLIINRILCKDECPRERRIRLAYLAGVLAVMIALGCGHLVLVYWIAPFLTTALWIGTFIELTEHYPLIETAPRIDIYMSRNRQCSIWANFLLGLTQYEGYHLVHHKFPAVPPWRNEEVHRILMEDPVYRSLNQIRGWKALIRTVIHFKSPDGTLPEH